MIWINIVMEVSPFTIYYSDFDIEVSTSYVFLLRNSLVIRRHSHVLTPLLSFDVIHGKCWMEASPVTKKH